jgi:hypothetical protein|tara:strand:+ start:1231 stop:2235 length:1005 start_codon:yes stop_codon:yes gene_type:complete
MKDNALAIGISSLEFTNILCSYYPKGIKENFDIYLFVDNNKIDIDKLQCIFKEHDLDIFINAKIIILKDVYDHYIEKHQYKGNAKKFLLNHGCLFKILMPIYLREMFGVKRTYVSDDDVFILNDLSYMWTKYKEFGIKKENLFYIRNKNKYDVMNAFNEIFESDFTLDQMNGLAINAGNIIYDEDPKLEYYFERFMKHPFIHHMFFDFSGYTSWTVEQRFHHFNIHRYLAEGKEVKFLESKDLRLMQNLDKDMKAGEPPEKYLKEVVPSLIHYAIGTKKPLWLNDFLPGLKWRYGFDYKAKYELKDILYNKDWRPPSFKSVQKKQKELKTKSVF